jgi:hypothetical protein
VDDILRRLSKAEHEVSDLKAHISFILTTIPYLATKAELKGEKPEVQTAGLRPMWCPWKQRTCI